MIANTEKKLIILSDQLGNGVATVTIHKNNFGLSVLVNARFDTINNGLYSLILRNGESREFVELGVGGRICSKFNLRQSITDWGNIHCIVVKNVNDKLEWVLYGTNSSNRLWQGNILDGIDTNAVSTSIPIAQQTVSSQSNLKTVQVASIVVPQEQVDTLQQEIAQQEEEQDPFQQIKEDLSYDDSAITQINYYNNAQQEELDLPRPKPNYTDTQYIPPIQDTQPKPNIHCETLRDSIDVTTPPVQQYSANPAYTNSVIAASIPKEYGQEYRMQRDRPYSVPSSSFGIADYKEIPSVQQNSSQVGMQHIEPITFWEQVQEQLDNLFANFPADTKLAKILPDTKWVKVDYDNNGKYFVVGVIGKDKPQFICYGVPSNYTAQAPKELDGYCQWLPIDDNPQGKGYWLMYQDAITGESVTL